MILYYCRLSLLITLIILLGLIGIVFSLCSPFNPRVMVFISRLIGHLTLFIFNIKLEIRGAHYLKKDKASILISNHQSNLDMVIGGIVSPWKTVSLGKKEIVRIPIYGIFYWLSGNILIDRSRKQKASETLDTKVTKALQDNTFVWIMPEGTRSYDKGLLPFKRGAFRTVISAKVPLIPIVISPYHATLDFLAFRPGKIIVSILPPIDTRALLLEDDRRLTQDCFELYKNEIERLQKELNS